MGLLEKMKAAREHAQFDASFGDVRLVSGRVIVLQSGSMPVKRSAAGVSAEVESGAEPGGRTTLTRVAAGAVLAGPVGAIVGGMFKKDRNKVYVTVLFPDGKVVVMDAPSKDEARAREFAARVNAAGRHYAE